MHRAPGLLREQRRDDAVFPRDLLGAKAPTHVLSDDPHVALGYTQFFRDPPAHRVDALRRLVEHERLAFPRDGAAVRLERVMQRTLCGVRLIDHDLRFA